jgi:hypothetical protein
VWRDRNKRSEHRKGCEHNACSPFFPPLCLTPYALVHFPYTLSAKCYMLIFSQTRRYPKSKIEILKNFLQFLYSLPNNDLWLFFVFFVSFVVSFFRPNAQLRPIIERRSFSAPRLPRACRGVLFENCVTEPRASTTGENKKSVKTSEICGSIFLLSLLYE